MNGQWNHKIFTVSPHNFESFALEIFRFQAAGNPVYKSFVETIGIRPGQVSSLRDIPFLPIRFFKNNDIVVPPFSPAAVFESSGTTAGTTSRHLVKDLQLYEESFLRAFELFYGPVSNWCILGLLPSYLENGNSSLVYMVNKLIQSGGHAESGFYMHDHEALKTTLLRLEEQAQPTLLIGVTYALLDFAERYPLSLKHTIVMETGGMKGRRQEMIRDHVHAQLKNAFGIAEIQSEYGMTELLSQAYSRGQGLFNCPPWMKIMIREEDDPLALHVLSDADTTTMISGALNIIDLANVYSCSFIASDDIGKLYKDGGFEVQGRMDASDVRGCNLLIA